MDRRSIVAVALAFLAPAADAEADEIVPAPGNRAFTLELPTEVFAQSGAALSVELDGYDVTAFSRVTGTTLAIDLETPLPGGPHPLMVLLFLPDGRVDVVVDAVVQAPELQGVQWSFNTTLQTNYRTGEHPRDDFDGVDRSAGSGGLSLGGEKASGRWRLTSSLDAVYDGDRTGAPADADWLLPSYTLAAAHVGANAETSIGAGNVKVARDDFLFSRFQRRGAAVASAGTSGRFDVQAFIVASTPRNRFDGGYLAPADANDRASGVSASVELLEDHHLRVGGGFVDGKTAFGGAGFNSFDDAAIYGGDTWNVTLDSRPARGSVWLHLEQARSEFDADGLGIGLPARKDDARAARLRLSSLGRFSNGPFAYWSADLSRRRVGTDFYSVGNLAQPGNVDTDAVALEAGSDAVALALEVSEQRTNPDRDPLLPTQRLQSTGLDFTYTPVALDPQKQWWRRLGAPSLRGWLVRSESSQPDEDALLAGFDLDDRTDEWGLALSFARAALTWAIEAGTIDYVDRTEALVANGFLIYEPSSDSRNVHASVQVSWAPGPRVALDAYLQRNTFDESDFGDEQRTTNYGVSGTFFLLPDKLSLFVSANQGRDRRRFGDPQFLPEHSRARFASMQLNWLVTEAAGKRPGIGLYVKANYARNEDVVFLIDDSSSSLHVGANVTWAHGK